MGEEERIKKFQEALTKRAVSDRETAFFNEKVDGIHTFVAWIYTNGYSDGTADTIQFANEFFSTED